MRSRRRREVHYHRVAGLQACLTTSGSYRILTGGGPRSSPDANLGVRPGDRVPLSNSVGEHGSYSEHYLCRTIDALARRLGAFVGSPAPSHANADSMNDAACSCTGIPWHITTTSGSQSRSFLKDCLASLCRRMNDSRKSRGVWPCGANTLPSLATPRCNLESDCGSKFSIRSPNMTVLDSLWKKITSSKSQLP